MKIYKNKKYLVITLATMMLCGILGYVVMDESHAKLLNSKEKIEISFSAIIDHSNKRLEKVDTLIGYLQDNRIEDETVDILQESHDWVSSATTIDDIMMADSALTTAIFRMFAKIEASLLDITPDENLRLACEDIKKINGIMSKERKEYNHRVMEYNELLSKFPTNLIAKNMGYREYTVFTMSGEGRLLLKDS